MSIDGLDLCQALRDSFISVNEKDPKLNPANVVDGLWAIARAIHELAEQVGYLNLTVQESIPTLRRGRAGKPHG
jgi:hypothetical protein